MARDPLLPIDDVLEDVAQSLRTHNRLVLAAPPGAGKTTRIPLHLHEATNLITGKILVLEPRRIAARGAAARMAHLLGETVGQTIGLSTRLERRVSKATRVEVITDGLFTRRILSDPELSGIGAVIFDEVHERSLNLDIGLALAIDSQTALREDLRLVLMSATLDTARFSQRLDAPIIESAGRSFPIEDHYCGRPKGRLDQHMAQTILKALHAHDGSVLAFLPGMADIRRTFEALETSLPGSVELHALHGGLSPADQDRAIRPATDGTRKIVLATDIAESAITIEGVNIVVDAGLVRVPDVSPSGRRTRLTTQRASRASVDQRRGRAGRTAPGHCYRLWDSAETRGLTAEIIPEIVRADLSGLAMALAEWGERDAARLTWLDPPPDGRLSAARTRLTGLGALNESGALTERGRAMAKLPMSPDMAALIVSQPTPNEQALGAQIAALLSERGLGGSGTDLPARLTRFRNDRSPRATTLLKQARRWGADHRAEGDPARVIARAWPDAIARRRGSGTAYLTAAGDAAALDEADPLARHDWLVIADAVGQAKSARITLAAPISEREVTELAPPQTRETAIFNIAKQDFTARRVRAIGAINLSETPLPAPSGRAAREALLDALSEHGLSAIRVDQPVGALLARIAIARKTGATDLPEWTPRTLAQSAGEWLLADTGGRFKVPGGAQVCDALRARLDWDSAQLLDTLAPTSVQLPSGRRASIDYLGDNGPLIEARVQEMFGGSAHPAIGRGSVPLTIALLSPARRPVAITSDLPGFWSGGYVDMAKDMRARYPKHDWPDDPATARPHEGHTKARLGRG